MKGNYSTKMPLIMMAGTDFDNKEPLLEYAGVDYKALIKINGKSVITKMLEEFHLSGRISHYYIVGIPEELVEVPNEINNIDFVETNALRVPGRIQETAKFMLQQSIKDNTIFLGNIPRILFVGADLPFLNSDIIKNFCDQINDAYNLHISIVKDEIMDKRFPGSNRTYAKLIEGRFCMGDMSSWDVSLVDERMDKITAFRENRKNFLKVIFKLKPMALFRYLLNKVSIKYAEEAIDKIFDMRSQVIQMQYAEIAFDIDKSEQLDIARKQLYY